MGLPNAFPDIDSETALSLEKMATKDGEKVQEFALTFIFLWGVELSSLEINVVRKWTAVHSAPIGDADSISSLLAVSLWPFSTPLLSIVFGHKSLLVIPKYCAYYVCHSDW